jgi:hypothetical protein
MADDVRTEIRSYRAVFDLERRIYRVDRLRLNPAGVPLRGCVYAVIAIAIVLVASALPVLGGALRWLPWHVRDLVVPVGAAALATMVRVDGRPAHMAARALWRHLVMPRRLSRFAPCREPARWHPGAVVLVGDGGRPRFGRLRFDGPGAVLVGRAYQRTSTRRGLTITERLDRPRPAQREVVVLGAGSRLDVRPASGGEDGS